MLATEKPGQAAAGPTVLMIDGIAHLVIGLLYLGLMYHLNRGGVPMHADAEVLKCEMTQAEWATMPGNPDRKA